jgi:hypothetical protein
MVSSAVGFSTADASNSASSLARTFYVAEGIDPGWDHNVGLNRARNVANFLGDRLDRLPAEARPAAVSDILLSSLFREVVAKAGTAKVNVPVAPVTVAMLEHRQTNAKHVFLSSDGAHHMLVERKARGLKPEDFANAATVLMTGRLIKKDDPRALIFIGPSNGRMWRIAVKFLADEVFITSFHDKGRIK